MMRMQTITTTQLVHLARFDHPREAIHHDPKQERAPHYSASFVERGQFDLRIGGRSWRLAPGMIFITRPGLVYRSRHPEPIPTDVCLSVMYSTTYMEAVHRTGGDGSGRTQGPWVVQPTNRLAYLYRRLAQWVDSDGEDLTLETLASELLSAVAEPTNGRLYRDTQLGWYTERIDAARTMLETQYAETHSLAALGHTIAMSPFHFARVFRELTGTPPHRYLLRVRLERAAQRLRDGASVTEACYACGFNNLSHFTRLFRRSYGVSPSRFRN